MSPPEVKAAEKDVFELAKKIDKLAYEEQKDWDIVSSALLFMLQTMLEQKGVDTAPLEAACREMGLVNMDNYN